MIKKAVIAFLVLIIVGSLVACGGTAATTQVSNGNASADTNAATNGSSGTNSSAQSAGTGQTDQNLNSMLAVGTIELEGTDLAVTAEQATTLLPLWKAVKSLSASDTVTQDEVNAVYAQIQEAMTSDQLQAISAMSLTQDDLTALMDQYGLNDIISASTPDASSSSGMGGGRDGSGGGMPSGAGGSMPSGGGDMSGGMAAGGDMAAGGQAMSSTPQAQGTPGAGGRGGGMMNSTIFVEPVIEILTERAG